MAKYPVTLTAVFDDVANTVTLSGMGNPPAGPASIPAWLWFGQTGPGFEVTFAVSRRNITAAPTAIYIVPDSNPVERRQVQYVNGAWQMPGVVVTE